MQLKQRSRTQQQTKLSIKPKWEQLEEQEESRVTRPILGQLAQIKPNVEQIEEPEESRFTSRSILVQLDEPEDPSHLEQEQKKLEHRNLQLEVEAEKQKFDPYPNPHSKQGIKWLHGMEKKAVEAIILSILK